MDQPGKVSNPARGQLNRENNIPLSPYAPDNLVSRDGFSRPVPSRVVQITLKCLRYTCTVLLLEPIVIIKTVVQ